MEIGNRGGNDANLKRKESLLACSQRGSNVNVMSVCQVQREMTMMVSFEMSRLVPVEKTHD